MNNQSFLYSRLKALSSIFDAASLNFYIGFKSNEIPHHIFTLALNLMKFPIIFLHWL